jgi:hypothetical protein
VAKRRWVLIAIAAAMLVAGGSAATFASTTARAQLYWGKGIEAALPADAATSGGLSQTVGIDSISCASAGNCTAVGSYTATSGSTEGLLLSETDGKWARGVEAPLPANAATTDQDAELDSVSCASPGNCTAVGSYKDSSDTQGLMLTETAGTWARGVEAVLPAHASATDKLVFLNSVSCASAGNCSAVGGYNDDSGGGDALLLTETAGTWGAGTVAVLPANAATPNETGLNAVSCASAGNCTAVGGYQDSSLQGDGLVVTETAGVWGTGVEASPPSDADTTDPGAFLVAVSCPSLGNCGAVGDYNVANFAGSSFTLTETAGSWTRGVEAALPRNARSPTQSDLNDVSCASAGNCVAVGGYADRRGSLQGLVVSETAGSWSKGSEAVLPADAASDPYQLAGLESVSCVSAGRCAAVGQYTDDSDTDQGLLLSETAGRWAPGVEARSPSNAVNGSFLDSVSCPSAESCSAAGGFGDTAGSLQGLLIGTAKAPPCVVPRLKGKTLRTAKRSIRAHSCSVGRIRHAASRRIKKGRVISQRPRAGSRRQYLAKVNLVVSKGRRRHS